MRPTRFDVFPGGNNALQHKSCNRRHNDDKSIYRNAFIERYGDAAYEELEKRALSGRKFTVIERHEMIERLQAMVK
jgi:hypothetical protein